MTRRNTWLAALPLTAVLAGCASGYNAETGLYAKPLGGAPATRNDTAYSAGLRCLSAQAGDHQSPRIAVGVINDLTGKRDFETGARVTQGAALFTLSALGKAGLPVVERTDRSISDVELQYAREHTLSDSPEAAGQIDDNFREIFAGQIAGSRYYIAGGITELNYNIRSEGLDARGGDTGVTGLKASLTGSRFIINVAIDMRLIDTRTQEVVDITSYQKQIVGREIKAGVFDFLNGNVFDVSGGVSNLEPIQLAVRTLVERSVYDFAARVYEIDPGQCLDEARTGAGSVPERRQTRRQTAASQVAAAPRVPAARTPTPQPPPAAPSAQAAPAPVQTPQRAYSGPYLDRSRWLPVNGSPAS